MLRKWCWIVQQLWMDIIDEATCRPQTSIGRYTAREALAGLINVTLDRGQAASLDCWSGNQCQNPALVHPHTRAIGNRRVPIRRRKSVFFKWASQATRKSKTFILMATPTPRPVLELLGWDTMCIVRWGRCKSIWRKSKATCKNPKIQKKRKKEKGKKEKPLLISRCNR